jgi:hypothetical protein
MVYFQTKKPNLGNFWRVLGRIENADIFNAHLEYVMAIWYIVWSFGNSVVIYYNFLSFGILCHEKSGNPALYPCPSVSASAGQDC